LIIRAVAVGDFVLNLPALHALQKFYAEAVFTLVGYPSTLEVARDFLRVARIHSIEQEPWSRLFYEPIEPLNFDRSIVWMKDPAVARNLRRSGVVDILYAQPFPRTGHAGAHLLHTVGLPAPDLPDRWNPSAHRII